MNTLLAPQRPSNLDTLRQESRDPRTAFLDRVALRLALRLLLWSARRPRLADDRTRHAHAFHHREATARRERAYQREACLAPRS